MTKHTTVKNTKTEVRSIIISGANIAPMIKKIIISIYSKTIINKIITC